MKPAGILWLTLAVCFFLAVPSCSGTGQSDSGGSATLLHERAIVIDAHAHPRSNEAGALRLAERTGEIEVDFITMREGGLDAVFFSVPFLSGPDVPWPEPAQVLVEIDSLKEEIEVHGSLAELASSPEDIRRIHDSGKRAVLLSSEAWHPFGGAVSNVGRFHSAGVRMATFPLPPADTPESDGGQGGESQWNDYGRRLIEEMNRLGMIIDISHAPDEMQLEIIRTSVQPVVASLPWRRREAWSVWPSIQGTSTGATRMLVSLWRTSSIISITSFESPESIM
jgi:membrane dipeptidase